MQTKTLYDLVRDQWPFDEAHYPELAEASPERKSVFTIKHVLMHQQKSIGRLVDVLEPADHGAPLEESVLQLAAKKMFLNALRFAELVGVSPKALEAFVVDSASFAPAKKTEF